MSAGKTRRQNRLTPWGIEVKKKLLERGMMQDELIETLRRQGYQIHKVQFTMLLRGQGRRTHQPEIEYISRELGIETQFRA